MSIQVIEKHIEMTPGVVGGKPHIAGRRITVQNIAVWHEHMGQSIDEICDEYDLSLAEVHAALSYYFDHREEIEQQIKEDDAFVAALRQQTSSPLQEKLNASRSE
jgi:uncharacterized protein (DUF433 family)